MDSHGNVEYEELKGLPVHTVIGLSPIEAWGKVLTKLGLTDEFMSGTAMHAVAVARQMGFQEAKGKIESKYQRKSTTPTPSTSSNIPPKSENGGDLVTTSSSNGAAQVTANSTATEMDATNETKPTAEGVKDEPTPVRSAAEREHRCPS